MDSRETRRELANSVRLLMGEERWLFAGLAGGAVGHLIWLAGTGVAVDQFARVFAESLSADQRSIEIWSLALLWVVLPSVVAVRYVVGHLTNIRGNIEQCYRFDQPILLLVPPLILVCLALGAGVMEGAVGPAVLVALGVANVVLLVRTVAYGYRVYSLSMPRLLQGLLFVAAVVVSLGVASETASLAGQAALVDTLARRYGLAGSIVRGSVSAPLLPLLGATVPGILALSYVWVQIFASLIVRIQRPDVPRTDIRAGQRYPQVVQPGTSRRLAMGTVPEPQPADAAADSTVAGTDGGQTTDSADEQRPTPETTAPDRFGQTKVYTPPEERGEDCDGTASESGCSSVKNELCPICGATYAADAGHTHCPNCNAVLDQG